MFYMYWFLINLFDLKQEGVLQSEEILSLQVDGPLTEEDYK